MKEVTISSAKMTYQIEAMRLLNHNKTIISNFIDVAKAVGDFPKELIYVTSFYDSKTGSSGSLFKDENVGNYILAYTGTNPYTDAVRDISTDIYSIGLGQGTHYQSCFKFYKKVREKYGDNIILTGHSLGGNIVQRVALEFNVPKSVIYNSAPLYIQNGVDLFMDITDENRPLYTKRMRRYNRNVHNISEKEKTFTGQIIHFSSSDDVLNRSMNIFGEGAKYVCENYILKNGGLHSIKSLYQSSSEIMKDIIEGKEVASELLSKEYTPFTAVETETLLNVSRDRNKAIDYFGKMFFGNEQVLNILANITEDIDMSKFFKHLIDKVENKS